MQRYHAPLRDIEFLLHDVFEAGALWASLPGLQDTLDDSTARAILEDATKLASGTLAPLNRSGDEEGTRWHDGEVSTPGVFREAFRTYTAGGWVGLGGKPLFGDMGMPKMLAVHVEEMLHAANSSFMLYSVLGSGACLAIDAHASQALKETYLPNLYAGVWAGSMRLTELHAGTDQGLIRTRAQPEADGSYRIVGSKIFITGGEHDLTDNIIHLVLAKLPDRHAGAKGISLFLVPKVLVNDDGSPGQRNAVSCSSIEQDGNQGLGHLRDELQWRQGLAGG